MYVQIRKRITARPIQHPRVELIRTEVYIGSKQTYYQRTPMAPEGEKDLEMLNIAGKRIHPSLLLAPMTDITGWAFRSLIRYYGGCGLYYSEMLNSCRVPKEADDSPIFKGFAQEDHLVMQLIGNDPVYLRESVKRLERFRPFGYDLNMGCSRALIMKHGWGAVLLSDISKTASAVKAMREATRRPLTVKLRVIWSGIEHARDFLGMLADEGVDAVIVHPRTPEKIFTRPAKWEWIQEIKSIMKIPVIGNGDIQKPEDALEMMEKTGCDGVMIGRQAIAQPSIFRDIKTIQEGGIPDPLPENKDIFNKFIDLLGEEINTPKRLAEARAFCEYFAQGLPVPHWFWGPIQGEYDINKIISFAHDFFARNKL